MHIRYLQLSAILCFSCCCWTSEVFAANQELPQQPQQISKPRVSSARPEKNPRMLLIQGWHANQNGDYALGAQLATRALAIDTHEIDAHLVLAQALQGTYEEQTEKDESLLLQCMREWLIVYRAQGGEEEGLTARGVGAFTDMYADEERGLNAKKQMVKLTGIAPRLWETDAAYMNRIARRRQRNVSGKVVKSSQQRPAIPVDK